MTKHWLCLSLMSLSTPLFAEEAVPDFAQETLSGDWQGKRKEWYQSGVDIGLNYKGDWFRNARGGAAQGGGYMWLGDAKLKLDGEKLFDWKATTVYFQVQTAYGGKLNQRYTGSTMGFDNLEVPVSTTKLFHAWIDKGFADGRFSVLFGLYPIDYEFDGLDASGIFLNPSFGVSAELSGTALGNGADGRAPSIFNTGSPGVRFKAQPAPGYYAQLALNDGRPVHAGEDRGTHIHFERGDGTLAIAEIGLKPGEAGWLSDKLGDKDKKFDGISKLAVGAWQYAPKFDDWLDTDANGQPLRRREYGAYVLAEQTVYAGISVFFRHGVANPQASLLDAVSSFGFSGKGLFAARPNDTYGLAATRGRASSQYRQAQALQGVVVDPYEQVVEATYRAQLTPYAALQPSLQYIRNPGLKPEWKDAVVYGARFEVAF